MRSKVSLTPALALFALIGSFCLPARADSVINGSFTADNQTYTYDFTATGETSYTFFTTSYGGGKNVDGTTTAPGGFVPVLTLFNADGTVIGPSITGGNVDPITGLSDDAYLSEVLGPGSYMLVLSEFPNVALGNLSDGFLFAADPDATGTVCGATGPFLEADLAPCVQRTGNFTLDTSSRAVPEPSSWVLVLTASGIFVALYRRRLLA